MSRRLVREAVFKALFQVDVGGAQPGKALQYILDGVALNPEEIEFCGNLFRGTIANKEEIDVLIANCLVDWELERIASVDRNLLRMAIYEMLYCSEIPPLVSIDEALDLTRKYSDENSVSFVNGILDRIFTEKSLKN